MKRKHFILIGVAAVLAISPVLSPFLVPGVLGAVVLGVATLFWMMREVDAEDESLRQEIKAVREEIAKSIFATKDERGNYPEAFCPCCRKRMRARVEN